MKRHKRSWTIHITRYYPAHEDREQTYQYRQTREQLIDIEKRPCWVCETRKKLECHHFYVEWADKNAVDWDTFMEDYPDIIDWASLDDPADFVDMPENMLILCAKHHRHINHGIHTVPHPSWRVQRHMIDGFKFAK